MVKWERHIAGLRLANPIHNSHCYCLVPDNSRQYCSPQGFCDYVAVVYLNIKTPDVIAVTFNASKTRVSHLSGHTISRLELLAALLLCKLLKNVMQSLEVEFELEKPSCFTL